MKEPVTGAGIGGLTRALFLHRLGMEAELFEQAEAVREHGVGIDMLPHAVRELAPLKLLDALDQTGISTGTLIYANRFGQPVWQEPRGVAAGYAMLAIYSKISGQQDARQRSPRTIRARG
jgi:2-polyprenyl-6-methoxyphenol hydroxylase-like FAD-dependent oxidoreductase